MRRSRVHTVNIVLSAVCIGLGGGAYGGLLPARMGILPLFPILSATLFYGGAWWIQRFPFHVNMPDQAAYDALSEEDQQKVNACMPTLFLLVRHAVDRMWDCQLPLSCPSSRSCCSPGTCQYCERRDDNTFSIESKSEVE